MKLDGLTHARHLGAAKKKRYRSKVECSVEKTKIQSASIVLSNRLSKERCFRVSRVSEVAGKQILKLV